MSYDSYIFDRVQIYSEVIEEQLRHRESATAVEEETCSDPIPPVSPSGVPGTSGMNYQLMVTFRVRSCSKVSEEQLRDRKCLKQSEEMVSGS